MPVKNMLKKHRHDDMLHTGSCGGEACKISIQKLSELPNPDCVPKLTEGWIQQLP